MEFDLNNKIFRSVSNTENSEVGSETLFLYHQENEKIWAEYSGGTIVKGHLLGKVLSSGRFEFLYHHINLDGDLMVGKCLSTPEALSDGRLRMIEEWKWLCGDKSIGTSELMEVLYE
ncbi:MAG: hypothetical protein JEY94_05020 [Melioribacteraceae bacterium]|nr:hypothetical protein [Melioribacteraceae bacterium]